MTTRTALAAGFIVAGVTTATAHPHVWVDAAAEIVFDERGQIVAVRHHWRFDDAFSAYAVQGLDGDGDGALSREELQPLAQVNVDSLSEFGFFTFLSIGEYEAGFSGASDYWLEQDDGRLTLHYTLPLARPISASQAVRLQVYDPEYFVAFSLPSREAVRLAGAPADCDLKVNLARELDAASQQALAAVGPEQRELPPELKDLTEDLDNSATVTCPAA